MSTTIKICGIRDGDTAKASVSMGADYLGVVVSPSPRQVSLEEIHRISDRVPDARLIVVGRDVDETLFEQILTLPVRGVQLHGKVPRDWIVALHQEGKMAIATTLEPQADVILLDGIHPGSGEAREWTKPEFSRPIWIAGGLHPHNVRDVVMRLQPGGVDVSTGVEVSGKKSLRLIEQFIEEVKHADQEST